MCSLLEKGEIAYISIIIYILIELLKIIITPPINNADFGCVKNRCLLCPGRLQYGVRTGEASSLITGEV